MNGHVTVVAGLLLLPVSVSAQEVPDAGSRSRQLERPAVELPEGTTPEIEVEEPGRAGPTAGDARFTLSGFRITGASAFTEAELAALVSGFVGREIGFAELEEAAATITRHYRSHGYPVARAYLPPQEIRDSSVEIAVLEGRFGALSIENQSRVGDWLVGKYLAPARTGSAVHGPPLERGLLLLSDTPGAGVPDARLRPGANVGESDLDVKLVAQPLFRGQIGYDNFGNASTGRDRVAGRIDLVSPFGWGDLLSFEGVKEFPGVDYGRIGYDLPILGTGARARFGYSHLDYDLGHEFAPLDADGDADTWSFGASYPLFRGRRFNFYLNADIEYSEYEDRIGATDTDTERNNLLVTGGISGDFQDGLFGGGVTVWSFRWNAGELDIETPAAALIDDLTLNTDEVYQRWNFDLIRLQRLTDRMSLYVSLATQKADGNLDSSQKLIIGGPFAVRAFSPDEASGDSGYVLTGELRYDFDVPALPGSTVQLAGFMDFGHVTTNEDPFPPDADNHRNLSALGASLLFQRAGDFHARAVFAHRILGADSRSDPGDDARLWLEAVKYF